jgi:hypothetical protein
MLEAKSPKVVTGVPPRPIGVPEVIPTCANTWREFEHLRKYSTIFHWRPAEHAVRFNKRFDSFHRNLLAYFTGRFHQAAAKASENQHRLQLICLINRRAEFHPNRTAAEMVLLVPRGSTTGKAPHNFSLFGLVIT